MNKASEKAHGVFIRFFAPVMLLGLLILSAFCSDASAAKSADAMGASGEIVVEATTGRALYERNADVKMYPASTTKILTALVVLERLPLDYTVKIPYQAAGVEGSSIYLRTGEKLTVEELLYGLMLRSGNDAAVALAYAAAGGIEEFAELMNARAEECGAFSSHFVNPHGLHDVDHYTTARDLAAITAAAYRNDDFRRIVSTRNVVINGAEGKRYLSNKNKLLTRYDGANGVKTGYTTKSGRCLVGGAERGGMQLISVVLNRYDMWEQTERILDAAFSAYEMQPIKGLPVPEYKEGALNVEVAYDGSGGLCPSAYPVKKDGSETVNPVMK